MATQIIGYDNILENATITASTDINNATYSTIYEDVSSQATAPSGIGFSDDGTQMYIIDAITVTIYQYTLTTAWNLATSSYASKSKLLSGEDSQPRAVAFKSDGTKMYIAGINTSTIYQYTLGTAWDVSTASYDTVSKLVSSQDSDPLGIQFKPDGSTFYMIGNATDTVYQYTLGTDWNIGTASYASISKSVASQDNSPRDLFINSAGTRLYMVGSDNDVVYQYEFTTAWNVSTAAYNSRSVYTGGEDNTPLGVHFSSDNTKMYIVGYTNKSVFQYDVLGEAEGFEGENAGDWFTWDSWKPASSGASYLEIALDTAAKVDYFAVFGHNLGETDSQMRLYYSTDGGVNYSALSSLYEDIFDSHVIFETFTAVTVTHYRLVLYCPSEIASIAVVAMGERLELPKAAPLNVSPAPYSFGNTYLSSKSDTGRLLGRTLLRKESEVMIEAKMLSPTWVRDYWLPFIEHAEAKAFFYSWNYEDFPDDTAYCYIDSKADPVKYRDGIWNDVQLKAKAQIEL